MERISKTIIINGEVKELTEAIDALNNIEDLKVKTFDSPLQAFYTEEAEYRIRESLTEMNKEELQIVIERKCDDIVDELLESEEILNVDLIDNIISEKLLDCEGEN